MESFEYDEFAKDLFKKDLGKKIYQIEIFCFIINLNNNK